nr:unnamed protein product [Digitaria exilis]
MSSESSLSWPFSFSLAQQQRPNLRPNSRATRPSRTLPSPSLSLADEWALLVSFIFLAVPESNSSSSSNAARLRVAFPSRKFFGLYKPPPELLESPNQSSSFRIALAAVVATNPRVKPPPRFELSRPPSSLRARRRDRSFASSVLVVVAWRHRRSQAASRRRKPLTPKTDSPHPKLAPKPRILRPTPAKRRRAPPSPAVSAAAVEPSDPEPLDRDPTAEIEPDSKNGLFEGDQDQVYEEEPPQYFEEGNRGWEAIDRVNRPAIDRRRRALAIVASYSMADGHGSVNERSPPSPPPVAWPSVGAKYAPAAAKP